MNLSAALFSSDRRDWNTPEPLLDLVRELGPIALDPCGNESDVVRAAVSWWGLTRPGPHGFDGLAESWGDVSARISGLVFVNPPYGRDVGRWTAKCRVEATRGCEVIALLPARTDTRWFQGDCVPPVATAVCFLAGRLKFLGAPAPAPFPSAVVHWGTKRPEFRKVFRRVGRVWT